MSEARELLAENLNFDPSYARQRRLARYMLGVAVNTLRGSRTVWEDPADKKKVADEIESLAIKHGLIVFDDLHHAPACPANHWHKQRLPTGPCTCGARP